MAVLSLWIYQIFYAFAELRECIIKVLFSIKSFIEAIDEMVAVLVLLLLSEIGECGVDDSGGIYSALKHFTDGQVGGINIKDNECLQKLSYKI